VIDTTMGTITNTKAMLEDEMKGSN